MHLPQWRIQDFCEGVRRGSGGGARLEARGRVPGVDSGAKLPEKLSTFCDTTNNIIRNLVDGA